ncbi:MAG: hypothetical protein FWE50_01820 [Alphaproteobacteria bacterium]|nr:hypothetical protein [Alphaproteobacteria bacterium]
MRKLFAFAFAVLFVMPVMAADRATSSSRASVAASRAPTTVANVSTLSPKPIGTVAAAPKGTPTTPTEPEKKEDCRTAYRNCMDQFCLLDESEGSRCACSDAIHASKKRIQEIQGTQSNAENLYNEGVEREQRGAKANLVFSDGSKTTGAKLQTTDIKSLLGGGGELESDEVLNEDSEIGDMLYKMASKSCDAKLESCASEKEMEITLYSRMITADCKAFSTLLDEQKKSAEQNKATAEKAVRTARLEMLETTNLFNRGECLLAYRACISDKGGCGANFENCLDNALLQRRAKSCENVLDQCMAVRKDVLKDWQEESKMILADAAKYADKYKRENCLAKIEMCLEDGCSKATNAACLTNITVAAGICPIIDECDEIAPGTRTAISDKLSFLSYKFCQNDFTKCLEEKCGPNFDRPECIGKRTADIIALCPSNLFVTCKSANVSADDFTTIVNSALLGMDFQMLEGCKNYVAEVIAKTNCGPDMSCLPPDPAVAGLTKIPSEAEKVVLRQQIRSNAATRVKEFFDKLTGTDSMIAKCSESKRPAGRSGLSAKPTPMTGLVQGPSGPRPDLKNTVIESARFIGEMGYEQRELRNLEARIVELNRTASLAEKRKNCETGIFAPEKPQQPCIGESAQRDFRGRQNPGSELSCRNYSFIVSSHFEEALSNCHVCRKQQVCATGGESQMNSLMKGVGGGAGGMAGMGSAAGPWGALIGGVVGGVAGGVGGALNSNMQDVCHEIESCEDVNM